MKRRVLTCLMVLCLLLPYAAWAAGPSMPRLPGPYQATEQEKQRIRDAGSVTKFRILNYALSLLEEGNPFLARYNLITGLKIKSRFPYGVPYLYGGQSEKHVFSKCPDYVVERAWQDSPAYYKAGTFYLYGFDCVGYIKWVWQKATGKELTSSKALLQARSRHVFSSIGKKMPVWNKLTPVLRPGDLLVLKHPGTHMALYIGTLRQYGYTAEEVPALAPWLDWPLIIHSTTDAGVSDRFAYLLKNGLSKYRIATVTDGGVCVSLLGVGKKAAPYHAHQQNQDTDYFVLPDNTWLSVLPFSRVEQYCWYRP